MSQAGKSVNVVLLAVGIAWFLVLVKVTGYFLPGRLYFSFTSFLFEEGELDKLGALAVKLVVPFAGAFALAYPFRWIAAHVPVETQPLRALRSVVDEQLELTVSTAAFFSAFLLAWPYIILWNVLINPELHEQRLVFLVAYVAYFYAYAYLARSGVQTAEALLSKSTGSQEVSIPILERTAVKPLVSGLSGAVSAVISTYLVALMQ